MAPEKSNATWFSLVLPVLLLAVIAPVGAGDTEAALHIG